MPGRLFVFIVLLALITNGLIVLALYKNQNLEKEKQLSQLTTSTPTSTPTESNISLFFDPRIINIGTTKSATVSSDIYISTQGEKLSQVQIELSFNPSTIKNIKISAPRDSEYISQTDYKILFNDINNKTGRISYAIEISPNSVPKTNMGKVVSISFQPIFSDFNQTQILYLDKTIVTKENSNQSILKNTIPLIINYISSDITSIPRPSPIPTGKICIQVIQAAKNPQTGECREFSTPCDVPQGWIKVDSCSITQ